jgi:diguanylate cyclase (GGDEF)-like protein
MGTKKAKKREIPEDQPSLDDLKKVVDGIRSFIELSLNNADSSWEEWLALVDKEPKIKCWERKNCKKISCPAYLNPKGRCWLVAGTMCGGKVQGEFALKYKSCTKCDIYREAVLKGPVSEIYEHLITLVHSLKLTQDRLRTLATRDMLTDLYNRNYFNETIVREIEKAKRYGEKLSIIMIDVDNFKQINDNYGHLHGDGVLRECASILKSSVRSSDFLCRFGGDEFLIATPHMDCRENNALIKRIRKRISDWNEEYSSYEYELSFSIGCYIWESGKDIWDVVNEADRLMYKDKEKQKANNG